MEQQIAWLIIGAFITFIFAAARDYFSGRKTTEKINKLVATVEQLAMKVEELEKRHIENKDKISEIRKNTAEKWEKIEHFMGKLDAQFGILQELILTNKEK